MEESCVSTVKINKDATYLVHYKISSNKNSQAFQMKASKYLVTLLWLGKLTI